MCQTRAGDTLIGQCREVVMAAGTDHIPSSARRLAERPQSAERASSDCGVAVACLLLGFNIA